MRLFWSFLTTAFVLSASAQAALPAITVERTVELRSGETLSQALNRAGISAREAHNFIQPLRKHVNMARFQPGQKIEISYTESAPRQVGEISSISFHTRNGTKTATASREGEKITAALKTRPLSKIKSVAVGRINGSLYMSAKRAGLPASLVPSFANIFAYEMDFTRDIQPGDTFKVVFEEIQDENGEFLRTGSILAAELNSKKITRTAFRFAQNGIAEYYDAKGSPKKKLLMRTPIEFARISSHFNPRRKHPVLGYTRAHKGTDFAAPTGTPIKASGSGVIERANRYGSFGNYIKIRHNGTYKTAYAHLHRFARGIRAGKRVKQGQIIGYVGTTGRSTGPHLHYEVHKHGRAINAMSAKIPAGNPLPKRQQIPFKRMVAEYQSKWHEAATQLASVE